MQHKGCRTHRGKIIYDRRNRILGYRRPAILSSEAKEVIRQQRLRSQALEHCRKRQPTYAEYKG
jgi:hypothetical protein